MIVYKVTGDIKTTFFVSMLLTFMESLPMIIQSHLLGDSIQLYSVMGLEGGGGEIYLVLTCTY